MQHASGKDQDKDQSIPAQPKTAAGETRYAYKASLIGAAHLFELTDSGLSWRVGGRAGVLPYADVASIRLSYRPVSMQARRFRADIKASDGRRLSLLSTTWQTAALMLPQSEIYRTFITELHKRLAVTGSKAALIGGLGHKTYRAALVLMALFALAMAGLLVRAVWTGEFWGAMFLIGFVALFAWQVGGFMRRNRPLCYTFDQIPPALLP